MIGFRDPHALAGLSGSESVLLALSGGADSSALLHALATHCKKNGATLYAAHVDHMIREDEHLRDAEFCRALGEKYGIHVFMLEADVPAISAESGESEELTARRVRYGFFAKIMQENNIPLLCTAHNADDNLETLIFNLTRGTGLRGMCGIPEVRPVEGGTLVRPILGVTKDEILAYCAENGLEYVTDRTNLDDAYSRNRIRLHVLPELRRLNPDAARAASRFSASVTEDYRFIRSRALMLVGDDGAVNLRELESADPAVARHAIALGFERSASLQLEAVHVDALLELCRMARSFSSLSLPGGMRGRIEGAYLRFSADVRDKKTDGDFEIPLKTGKNMLCEHIILYLSPKNEKNIYKCATQETIAFDKINGGLYARNRRPQDKIFLRGMHRDLRKLMSEKRIPPELRGKLPVICDGSGILYVPFIGLRDGAACGKDSDYVQISADI